MFNTLCLTAVLFAEGEAAPGAKSGMPELLMQLAPFLAIGLLFYFMLIRPHKTQENTRKAMLAALKKNDRVWTIGGVYGVIVNVERDNNVAVIKVDESTNTKLRVKFTAIAELAGESATEEAAK